MRRRGIRCVAAWVLCVLATAGAVPGVLPVPGVMAAASPAASKEAPATASSGGPVLQVSMTGAPQDRVSGRWDPATRRWVFAPPGARVTVNWQEWQVEADRLEWDVDGQTALVSGRVQVRRDDVDVACDRMTFRYAAGYAEFEGNVRLQQWQVKEGRPDQVLRTLSSDVMTLDDPSQKLSASGNVRVDQKEPMLKTISDRLEYNRKTGWMELSSSGGPLQATVSQFEVRKVSRIEFSTETEEVRLYGPADIVQLSEGASR